MSELKAMILAAGRGQRMRPLTDKTPKSLLKIQGKCLIEYHIEALRKAGIQELIINTGWLGQKIETFLQDGTRYNIRITYSREPAIAYETGGGILHALDLLSDTFIVVNGDVHTDYDYSRLPDTLKGQAHIVLVDNPAHHPAGDFALSDGYAANEGQPRLTFSGIGVYNKTLFKDRRTGKLPLEPILREAIQHHTVTAEHYKGFWNDVGTPKRLALLNETPSAIQPAGHD